MNSSDEIDAISYEMFADGQRVRVIVCKKNENFMSLLCLKACLIIALIISYIYGVKNRVISLNNWTLKGYIVKLEYSGFYNGEKCVKIEPHFCISFRDSLSLICSFLTIKGVANEFEFSEGRLS